MSTVTLLAGDVIEVLKTLPDKSVHACICSPPFYGLRSYLSEDHPEKQMEIGAEKSPELYIARLVEVFREVRRVLRDDGTVWLNLGDSFWAGKGKNGSSKARATAKERGYQQSAGTVQVETKVTDGKHAVFKPKDLMLIPARAAIALQEDGWFLRQDIIWFAPNKKPECLDPETTIFVRNGKWVSKITLRQLADRFDRGEVLPEILSQNGWTTIKYIWRTTKPAMAIEAGKVEHIMCSPEHKFPVSSERRHTRIRQEEAQNIRHEGYADYLLYCPVGRFLTPSITHWSGKTLDHALGYLIGTYAAEGGKDGDRGYRIKFTIGINETEFAKNIRLSFNRLSVTPVEWEEENVRYFRFSEKWIARTIAAFVSGDVRTKMLNIELILNCPEDFRQGILNGYVDGDGSDRKGEGWIIASASRRLRDDISTLASSLGIITSKGKMARYDKRTDKTYHAWSLWTPYMTKRKSKSGMEGVYQVPPRSKRMLGSEREMIDIEVEGGVFLIGDGLCTHNSVKDRPTLSHEHIFLFAKQRHYYYDNEAVKVEGAGTLPWGNKRNFKMNDNSAQGRHGSSSMFSGGTKEEYIDKWYSGKVQRRSVWSVPTKPFRGAHHAPWPEALVEPMLLASTSAKGCCSVCGAPWTRITKKENPPHDGHTESAYEKGSNANRMSMLRQAARARGEEYVDRTVTVGWQPSCECPDDLEPAPCTVIDIFMGSGTTGAVAVKHGRNFIGIDLKPDYLTLAKERIAKVQPLLLSGG